MVVKIVNFQKKLPEFVLQVSNYTCIVRGTRVTMSTKTNKNKRLHELQMCLFE